MNFLPQFISIATWFFMWIVWMGLPNYAFKKWKCTYHQYPFINTLWYITGITFWCIVYFPHLQQYFFAQANFSVVTLLLSLPILIFIPRYFHRDFFTPKERANYHFVKYFDVLCQQVGFLCGLLTFWIGAFGFGMVFFLTHFLLIFFIPRNSALTFSGASLIGGLLFSFLHARGPVGFMVAFFIHRLFYIFLHAYYTKQSATNVSIHKR